MKKLTNKQQRFASEYIKDLNGTRAYLRTFKKKMDLI